jgi:predicted dehydrogenase
MERLRVGVIGCGYIAGFYHVPALSKLPQVELAAAVDVREESAHQLAQQYHIRDVYTDYRRVMERDDIQAVVILTKSPTHHAMVLAAAQTGKHILMQKPFAANLAEAQTMIEAVTKAGIKLVTSFQHRYFPESLRAKEYLESDAIGRLRFIRQIHHQPELMDVGPHGIDLIRHFSGQRIIRVNALMDVYWGEPRYEPYSGMGEKELASGKFSLMEYVLEHGALANHHLGLEIAGYEKSSTELCGEEGVIILRHPLARGRLAIRSPHVPQSHGEWYYPELEPEESGGVVHHRLFVEDVLNGTWRSASLEDGLAGLKVHAAAHESAQRGVTVELLA